MQSKCPIKSGNEFSKDPNGLRDRASRLADEACIYEKSMKKLPHKGIKALEDTRSALFISPSGKWRCTCIQALRIRG